MSISSLWPICLRFPLYAVDFQEIIYCCHNVGFLRMCALFVFTQQQPTPMQARFTAEVERFFINLLLP